MIQKITDSIENFLVGNYNIYTAEIFRKTIYIYLIVVFLQELPCLSCFYSDQAYFMPVHLPWQFNLNFILNIMSIPKFSQYYYLVVGFQVLFCITGLFNKFRLLSSMVVYFTTVLLHNKSYIMLTGGDTLLNLLLLYLIFLQLPKNPSQSNRIRNLWNATVFFIIQLQIVILYFFSAFYKWLDHDWVSGFAMYGVLINPDFSHPLIFNYLKENNFLLSLSTWFVLVFQSLFPVLVYIKKFKKTFLFIGMAIHLGIFIIIGLFGFSMIMMITYIVFYNFKWEKIPIWVKRLLQLEYYGETRLSDTLK